MEVGERKPKIPNDYLDELNNLIVKIQKEGEQNKAFGFFLKINAVSKEYNFLLITNYNESFTINTDSEIVIEYNNKKTTINMKNRFFQNFNKDINIYFIEIIDDDILNDKDNYKFLSFDYLYKNKNEDKDASYKEYENKNIYSVGNPEILLPLEEKSSIPSGKIIEINGGEFKYSLDEKLIFSGMPICLYENRKLLGIQLNENKKDWGYFIDYVLKEVEKSFMEYKRNKVIIEESKKGVIKEEIKPEEKKPEENKPE